MSLKVIQPQEIEVWYALPALRKELAVALKKRGIEQKRIAELIGVTTAAVSQYVNNKRATELSLGAKIRKEIDASVDRILEDNGLMMSEIQRLLKILWKEGTICKLHKSKGDVPSDCTICEGVQ